MVSLNRRISSFGVLNRMTYPFSVANRFSSAVASNERLLSSSLRFGGPYKKRSPVASASFLFLSSSSTVSKL